MKNSAQWNTIITILRQQTTSTSPQQTLNQQLFHKTFRNITFITRILCWLAWRSTQRFVALVPEFISNVGDIFYVLEKNFASKHKNYASKNMHR